VLLDVDTGRVLVGANDHTPLPPGSLSKMLTAMIAADWLQSGSQVPVTPSAAGVYPFRVGMSAGQVWPLDMTMHALLIDSANDAAYALAERVSGSLGSFGATMKYAATEIGMRDRPVLHDPAGLDSAEGVDGGNLISAWDLAIAGRDMMANPYLAGIAGTKKYYFTAPDGVLTSLNNFNRYFLDWYPGAIGVKTGETDAAGFCVVEEAERGGRRMLAVVLGGENSYQTAGFLLDQGFATPVRSERADPALPPVDEPYPPPKHPILRQAALGDLAVAAAIDPSTANRPRARDYEIGGGVLGVVLLIAAAVLIRARRRRPLGAHSR
jgi:D-alanyl-D-alanine carboxypeptidase (penicillin-binding protein 5/6)